jgi:hypothetical protein
MATRWLDWGPPSDLRSARRGGTRRQPYPQRGSSCPRRPTGVIQHSHAYRGGSTGINMRLCRGPSRGGLDPGGLPVLPATCDGTKRVRCRDPACKLGEEWNSEHSSHPASFGRCTGRARRSSMARSGASSKPRCLMSMRNSRQLCALSRTQVWKPTNSFLLSEVAPISTSSHRRRR